MFQCRKHVYWIIQKKKCNKVNYTWHFIFWKEVINWHIFPLHNVVFTFCRRFEINKASFDWLWYLAKSVFSYLCGVKLLFFLELFVGFWLVEFALERWSSCVISLIIVFGISFFKLERSLTFISISLA